MASRRSKPAPKPCRDCGRLPKALPKQFCAWCQLRRLPVHEQARAAAKRLAMVPESARMKRSQKAIIDSTPPGTSFCAGCQTYMPLDHFGANQTQCRGCMNAKAHAKTLEKTYGIDTAEYDRLLAVQGGKCAICGRKPTGRMRLAVDHDHKTGAVRGLLCSGDPSCNHSLLGGAHDDPRMLWNAYVYLLSPPASGSRKSWWSYLDSIPPAAPVVSEPGSAFSKPGGKPKKGEPIVTNPLACEREHFLPAGSQAVPGKRGVWRVWTSDSEGSDEPF